MEARLGVVSIKAKENCFRESLATLQQLEKAARNLYQLSPVGRSLLTLRL